MEARDAGILVSHKSTTCGPTQSLISLSFADARVELICLFHDQRTARGFYIFDSGHLLVVNLCLFDSSFGPQDDAERRIDNCMSELVGHWAVHLDNRIHLFLLQTEDVDVLCKYPIVLFRIDEAWSPTPSGQGLGRGSLHNRHKPGNEMRYGRLQSLKRLTLGGRKA